MLKIWKKNCLKEFVVELLQKSFERIYFRKLCKTIGREKDSFSYENLL